jgi:hypothetical protein
VHCRSIRRPECARNYHRSDNYLPSPEVRLDLFPDLVCDSPAMLGLCYCVLDAEYWRDLSAEDNMLITTSGGMILPGPGA